MRVLEGNLSIILVFVALSISVTMTGGCRFVEQTRDKCRSGGHLWLAGGISRSVPKGTNAYRIKISEGMKELRWYCGYSGPERVAWGGRANRLSVNFKSNGDVIWRFEKCPPPECQTVKPPQQTSDRCRSAGYIWLADSIKKSIAKGTTDDSIVISRGMRELRWLCGYSAERVAWAGNANHLRVRFDWDGRIRWEFFTCNAPSECNNNNHPSSLHIELTRLTLTTAPTDNVAFGWESLFGRPADEIAVNLESKYCYSKSKTREIKQGQTLSYRWYPKTWLNSFREEPIRFWLTERDSGFEGKDDLSQVVTIKPDRMDALRKFFKHNPGVKLELNYSVTVDGKNIFEDHKWFGFIADNLCISALDFIFGPWTGSIFRRLTSKNMMTLYKTVRLEQKAGTLSKKRFFKAVMIYQLREGLKQSIRFKKKEFIKDLALSTTNLDEKIEALVKESIEKGLSALGKTWLDIYNLIIGFTSWLADLTGMVEFCLIEVLPESKDALYDVYFTVSK